MQIWKVYMSEFISKGEITQEDYDRIFQEGHEIVVGLGASYVSGSYANEQAQREALEAQIAHSSQDFASYVLHTIQNNPDGLEKVVATYVESSTATQELFEAIKYRDENGYSQFTDEAIRRIIAEIVQSSDDNELMAERMAGFYEDDVKLSFGLHNPDDSQDLYTELAHKVFEHLEYNAT